MTLCQQENTPAKEYQDLRPADVPEEFPKTKILANLSHLTHLHAQPYQSPLLQQ